MVKHAKVLLAGLSQLSLFTIAKPDSKQALENGIDELRYEELINEQNTFKTILEKLILVDRDPLIIREMIFILGYPVIKKLYLKLLYIFICFV